MENTFVSIFNGIYDKDSSKTLSVLDVVWKISGGEWKSLIDSYRVEPDKKKKESLKHNLPAVVFSGTFGGKERLDDNVENYTGLMVCDVDKISEEKLRSFKKKLTQDAYTLLFFESPSKGLKFIVKVDSELKFHKSHAFVQVEKYYMEHYGIKIDASGKNPARLCFISDDPNMYFNESSDVFNVDIAIDYDKEEADKFRSLVQHNPNFEVSNDSYYVFDVAIKWIKDSPVGSYHKGNRNNFIFALSCCLNRAGMSPLQAISLISDRYGSMGIKEVKSAVMSAYKHNSNEYGSKPIYKRKTNQGKLF